MIKKVILRYENTPLILHNYDGSALNQKEFTCEFISPQIKIIETETGRLKNGRGYSHTLWESSEYNIHIGANELQIIDNYNFVNDFFAAPFKYAIFYTSGNLQDYVYIEVYTDEKKLPVEFQDNIVLLPKINLRLYAK